MKLQLIIKADYLHQIAAGTKKQEFRDITHKNAGRYLDDNDQPRPFTSIVFLNGYRKDRKSVEVELLNSELVLLTDEEGKDLTYTHNGELYHEAQIIYTLGRIISKNY